MPILLINYDLNKAKDYPSLHQAIKNLGSWCHPADSCWLVHTSLGAITVRDRLRSVMDNDDSLLVTTVAVRESAAWVGMKPDVHKWLEQFLSPAYAY